MDTQQQKKFNILVIGDNCVDIYQYGSVERLSPEAPVPVFLYKYEVTKPGMAANVVENLSALDCNVSFLHGSTSVKTRLIDVKSKQHILRLDNDNQSDALTLETAIPDIYDAVVISDYDKGTVSYELMEEIIKEFRGPVFIDTKKRDLKRLEGAYVKINALEYSRIESSCSEMIITRGGDSVRYKTKQYRVPEVEVVDVCGAGDTFLAALTVEFLNTQNMIKAIDFAIAASSKTVQHTGVYSLTKEDINEIRRIR